MLFRRKDPLERAKKYLGDDQNMIAKIDAAESVMAAQKGPSAEERRLLETGAECEGVVTSHERVAVSQFGSETFYSVTVRFRTADGQETEVSCGPLVRDKVGLLEVADKVPVRYDPVDPSKAMLDLPALEARHQGDEEKAENWNRHLDDEKIAKAQAEIDGRVWVPGDPARQESDLANHRMDSRAGLAWTPIGGRLLPVEAEAEAGTGAVTCDGAMGELIEGAAAAAVTYVSRHAADLLPELADDWFSTHDIRIFQPYGGVSDEVTAADAESAGLAIAAALVSLLGGHLVRSDVALTGGLTASGELQAVHDLKGMKGVAKRTWTKRLVAPAANGGGQADPPQGQGLEVVFASNLAEALHAALAKHPLKGYDPPA